MAAIMEKLQPVVTGEKGKDEITIDTWFDRLMKALTVWLPLMVSGTLFLGEISGEPQDVFCYPPSNFSIPQANYLNGFCKESLVSEQMTTSMFPYFVLSFALLMYLPHLLWKILIGKDLTWAIANVIGEIERSWKRTNSVFADIMSSDSETVKKALVGSCMPTYSATIGLITSRKFFISQVTKIIFLVIFDLACLTYFIWFDIVSQKNDIFVCSAKLSSNNGTRDDEYLESVCKVVGKQYLYYVSILLSMSFCTGMLLPIYFVLYVNLTRNIFLLDILNRLKIIIEWSGVKIKQFPKKISPFSDFSVISRLCAENRHISPCLREMNIDDDTIGVPSPDIWVETTVDMDTNQDIFKIFKIFKEAGETSKRNLLDHNSDDSGTTDHNSDDSGATHPRASATTGNILDVEADIHPQPPSSGSSSSFLRFHTEDETRPKGLTGEETGPVATLHHRGSKNKSNPIEKETSV